MDKDFWERIDKLEELAKKATQAEWKERWGNVIVTADKNIAAHVVRYDDARFIAAANPAVVLALIEKIERLEKEAKWLAKNGQGDGQCPYIAFDWTGETRPEWCDCLDNGEEFDCDEYIPDCWRKAARESL